HVYAHGVILTGAVFQAEGRACPERSRRDLARRLILASREASPRSLTRLSCAGFGVTPSKTETECPRRNTTSLPPFQHSSDAVQCEERCRRWPTKVGEGNFEGTPCPCHP